MEIYWKSITYAYIIIDIIGMGFMLRRFARPFMERKRGAFWIGAAYSATMLILYFEPVPVNNFLAYSLGILAAFLVMCRIDRQNYCQKIFIATTFFSLRWLAGYMSHVVDGILYQLVIDSPYMGVRPVLQVITYAGVSILDMAVRFFVLEISIRKVVKSYVYKWKKMSVKEMCMLLVPSVVAMSEYAIRQIFRDTDLEGTAFVVYNLLACWHYGILIISIVVVIVLFQNLKAGQEEKQQNAMLDAQMESIRAHVSRVEAMYQDMRSLKHDMGNHMLTLERLYNNNRAREAKAYRAEIQAALGEAVGEMKSGNPVTDVILQEIKNEAGERKVRFQSDFHYPEASSVNVFDISVILHNGLQNGLEYAKGSRPWLALSSYRRNNAYMIEMRNSFTGELRWDEERGLPRTSKENTEGHGYGLANIKRVAGKYSGDIDILCGEGEFCLSVLLMLE